MNLEQRYSDFYILEHGWATKYFWLTGEISNIELNQKRNFDEYVKGGKITLIPQTGTTYGDILATSWATQVYSKKIVSLLKNNNIGDFHVWPIQVNYNSILAKYYYMETKSDPLPLLIGECEPEYSIDSEGKKYLSAMKGFYFDLHHWNGEYFFSVDSKTRFIVTSKLKQIMEKANLKNIWFRKISDYTFGKPTKWAKKGFLSKLSDALKL